MTHAIALQVGNMVLCLDGRVGLLSELNIFSPCLVKFGAGGPLARYDWKVLRKATHAEVVAAGLEGVGYLA